MSIKNKQLRNWPLYNRSLVKRGDITCWIDVDSWHWSAKSGSKGGRPKSYSDAAIMTMLVIKSVYHLSLRSCQGFVRSLFQMLKLDKNVPDYTTVCRRQKTVTLPKFPSRSGAIHLVIDSSGLKIFGEGEWKVRQHSWSKHRMWKKLHLGVDEKSQLIVSAILTGNDSGDDKKLGDVLKQYKGALKQVSLDGAYDSHECYSIINKRDAKAVIPPQPNPRHKVKSLEKLIRPRDFAVWEIQQKVRAQWKIDNDYHRRSLAETAFYRYKKLLGDKLSARTFPNQESEALIKCHILNKMTFMKAPNRKTA
jgi:IS5 family transposase